jgi:transposase
MELLSVIRRWHYRDHFSIREISRRTGLSRNTVRKYLRSDTVEPKFNIPDRPSKLDPYADKLSQMLRQEAGKSRKQKRTTKQLHADLAALGYDGSYNRVVIHPQTMVRLGERSKNYTLRSIMRDGLAAIPKPKLMGWAAIARPICGVRAGFRPRTIATRITPYASFFTIFLKRS